MSLILMILLVFGGGLVMCGTGGIIHYREDIKPVIEEIEEAETHNALKKEIMNELNQAE
ncbi:MAG TPA: hypothetical protein VMW42_03890 [Desulfatiglandales bacterium]|nr:hypothetical protein [Desulfatiglandales bacterium]